MDTFSVSSWLREPGTHRLISYSQASQRYEAYSFPTTGPLADEPHAVVVAPSWEDLRARLHAYEIERETKNGTRN